MTAIDKQYREQAEKNDGRQELFVLWDDATNMGVPLDIRYGRCAVTLERDGVVLAGIGVYEGKLEVLTWHENGEVAAILRVDYDTGKLVGVHCEQPDPLVLSAPEEA